MFLFLAAALIAVDQFTKYWAAQSFSAGGSLPLGLGFSFTYVQNTGAAFGIFRGLSIDLGPVTLDGTLLLGVLSAVVAAGLLLYLLRSGRQLSGLLRVALVLVLSGAVGNMIDRLLHRYVIDFIHFQQGSFDFPVFNVADACVVIGAGLLLIQGFLGEQAGKRMPAELNELNADDAG
jgi:signal peptidase II